MGNGRILCVDDEPAVLDGFARTLRRHLDLVIAVGGAAGLTAIAGASTPFEVVLSDMRMPGMDGLAFLTEVEHRSPTSVRMMLTGNADIQTAVEAVNTGHVFRFLTKPCPAETLLRAIQDGIRQHRLVQAEKELLEKTLAGSVRLLTEIIELCSSGTRQDLGRQRDLARAVATAVPGAEAWQLDLAVLLADVGAFTVPPELLERFRNGSAVAAGEQAVLARLPSVGARLVGHIPRLHEVARIILHLATDFDGRGSPEDGVAGSAIPAGARILRSVREFTNLLARGFTREAALDRLRRQEGVYDPQVLDALIGAAATDQPMSAETVVEITALELQPGDFLLSDAVADDGQILLAAGRMLSGPLYERLRNFATIKGLREPLRVRRPAGLPRR